MNEDSFTFASGLTPGTTSHSRPTGPAGPSSDPKVEEDTRLSPTLAAGSASRTRYTRSAFLDQLGEELANDTVPKGDIIRMLEEAVGEEMLREGDQLLSRGHGTKREDAGDAGASATTSAAGSPPREPSRSRPDGSSSQGLNQPFQMQPQPQGASAGISIATLADQDMIKNPRYMRQIREQARRTSLGMIQGLSVKRNRNYRDPKKVPAVLEKEEGAKSEGEGFWGSDEEHLEEEDSSIHHGSPTPGHHSPPRAGGLAAKEGLESDREVTPDPIVPRRKSQAFPVISPKSVPAPRPQSPVIIWRPNAAVRLATDLPRQCLNHSILNPQQDMKLTDLIKSNAGFDPLSLIKSNAAGQAQLPPEMKKTFSYYKQFVSNTMPSADEEKEVLSSKSRPDWGKRIPPPPKSEYGAWYIPPDLWESDMRLSDKHKEKKVQLMGENVWKQSIFDESRKGGSEAGMTALEVQEAQISEQIPNQYSSKMYKEYIKKQQGRLPHYLENVQ